jgi:hypothetical protein
MGDDQNERRGDQPLSRFPRSVYPIVVALLGQREGEKCRFCERAGLPLEIHHIDGDRNNNDPNNLCLACHICNCAQYQRLREEQLLADLTNQTPQEVSNTENPTPPITPRTRIEPQTMLSHTQRNTPSQTSEKPPDGFSLTQNRSHTDLSEIEINREKEPEFRRLVKELIYTRRAGLTYHDAVYEVSEMIGASPVSCRRYLDKMISKAGPLMLGKGKAGRQPLLLRESFFDRQTQLARSGQTSLKAQ